MNRSLLRRTLVDALREGGKHLRRGLGHARISYKAGRANVVTQVDLASEPAVVGVIRRRFPTHDFFAEEKARTSTGSDFVWVIDPLDGTLNFSHSMPVCCVSVAAVERGRAVVGGVYDPFREELFLAEAGHGATLNGRPMSVSRARRLGDSLLVTGFPYDRDKRAGLYSGIVRDFLERGQDLRRSGSAALDLAWTAAGRYDGFWEFCLAPWDVAAGRLLVTEAGGRVTDFSGKPWGTVDTWGRQTLASNGRIHPAMLTVLRKVAGR